LTPSETHDQGPFNPEFDDAIWNDAAIHHPLVQVPTGDYPNGYRVMRWLLRSASVFGRSYHLVKPMDCRALHMPDGTLWMSDVPQERMMMHANAMQARGTVLVGGLGLAMFPQYVTEDVQHLTIVEQSETVIGIVGSVLAEVSVGRAIPVTVVQMSIEACLAAAPAATYDTVFLDTWERLDPLLLPQVNMLRDAASRVARSDGVVLLWGYHWMVRMFIDACLPLIHTKPELRRTWLQNVLTVNPAPGPLLSALLHRLETCVDASHQHLLDHCKRFAQSVLPEDLMDSGPVSSPSTCSTVPSIEPPH